MRGDYKQDDDDYNREEERKRQKDREEKEADRSRTAAYARDVHGMTLKQYDAHVARQQSEERSKRAQEDKRRADELNALIKVANEYEDKLNILRTKIIQAVREGNIDNYEKNFQQAKDNGQEFAKFISNNYSLRARLIPSGYPHEEIFTSPLNCISLKKQNIYQESALAIAIQNQQVDLMTLLVENGADPFFKYGYYDENKKKWLTPLQYAKALSEKNTNPDLLIHFINICIKSLKSATNKIYFLLHAAQDGIVFSKEQFLDVIRTNKINMDEIDLSRLESDSINSIETVDMLLQLRANPNTLSEKQLLNLIALWKEEAPVFLREYQINFNGRKSTIVACLNKYCDQLEPEFILSLYAKIDGNIKDWRMAKPTFIPMLHSIERTIDRIDNRDLKIKMLENTTNPNTPLGKVISDIHRTLTSTEDVNLSAFSQMLKRERKKQIESSATPAKSSFFGRLFGRADVPASPAPPTADEMKKTETPFYPSVMYPPDKADETSGRPGETPGKPLSSDDDWTLIDTEDTPGAPVGSSSTSPSTIEPEPSAPPLDSLPNSKDSSAPSAPPPSPPASRKGHGEG